MIVGTITLITLLFFGGVQEIFLIDNLDKGVKEYVLEKERRDEILDDLKEAKTYISDFNNRKKDDLKLLKKINADRTSQRNEFVSLYSNLKKGNIAFKDRVISDRLRIVSKIKQDEWDKIIEQSDENVNKTIEKQAKEVIKDKFASIELTISKTMEDSLTAIKVLDSLQIMRGHYYQYNSEIAKINSKESVIINNRESTESDLRSLSTDISILKLKSYNSIVDFHFTLSEYCDEDEWGPIIKEFNRLLE